MHGRLRLGDVTVQERSMVRRLGMEATTLWRRRGAALRTDPNGPRTPPMSTLILTLPLARSGPATEYRYTLSPDGATARRATPVPVPACCPVAVREVVAVVPRSPVLAAPLPPGIGLQAPRLRAVLDGLLGRAPAWTNPHNCTLPWNPGPGRCAPAWVAICDRCLAARCIAGTWGRRGHPVRAGARVRPGPHAQLDQCRLCAGHP